MAKQLNVNMNFTADTSKAKSQIQDLSNSLQKIASTPISVGDKSANDLQKASQAAMDLQKHLQAAVNVNTGQLDLSRFQTSLNKAGQSLATLQKTLINSGAEGQQAFLKLSSAIANAQAPVTRINGALAEMGTVLKNTIRWQISSSILHGFMGAVQSAYGYAQDLNESLNNIRIVTGQNTDQMAQFAAQANAAAKALSTSTTKYTDAALIYYQQGLSDEAVQERTEATIKLANVSGQSAQEVSQQLTAVWNNFDDGTRSLESYVDVMTKIGAETSSSSEEIATGMEKFAAVADTVGLSFDNAAAALATITATTRQSADVVGTALKTLLARIQDLDLGKTLDDGVTLGKYSQALQAIGVEVLDASGNLKDMDTILADMGSKWQTLSEAQKVATAETVAGTRQYAQLMALMENFDIYEKNIQRAQNSEGTLNEQQEIYAQGWEAASKRVRASLEEIYTYLVDDNFFIGLSNGITKVLSGISGLIQGLGGFKGVLASIGSLFLSIYAKEMPSALENLKANLMSLMCIATQQMSKMQQDQISTIQSFSTGGKDLGFDTQISGLVRVTELKNQLLNMSGQLSKAEQAEAEAKIANTQAIYNMIAAEAQQYQTEQQELAKKEELTNMGMETYSTSPTDIRDSMGANETTLEEYQMQIDSLKQKIAEYKSIAGTGLDIDKDQQVIVALTSKVEKLKEQMKEALEQGQKDFAGELINSLKQIENVSPKIKEVTKDLQDMADKGENSSEKIRAAMSAFEKTFENSSALKQVGEELGKALQETDFEGAKVGIEQYLNVLNQAFPDAVSGASEEYEALNTALQSGDLESVKTSWQSFIEALNNNVFGPVEAQAEGFFGKLDDNTFQKVSGEASQLADSLMKVISQMMGVGSASQDVKNHVTTLSEAFTKITSAAMSFSAALNSFTRFQEVMDDKDATTVQKVTTSIMALVTGIRLLKATYSGVTALAAAFKTQILGTGTAGVTSGAMVNAGAQAGKIGLEQATGAAAGFQAALGVVGVVAAAIALVVTGIAIAISKHSQDLQKAAERSQEAADKAVEHADALKEEKTAFNDLLKSYKDALKTYEETGEGKEELNKLAYELETAYDIEGGAVAVLTGQYEDLTKAAEESQKARNIDNLAASQEALEKITRSMSDSAYAKGNKIDSGVSYVDEDVAYKILQSGKYDLLKSSTGYGLFGNEDQYGLEGFTIDTTDIVAAYEQVQQFYNELDKTMTSAEKNSSEELKIGQM